MTRIIDVIGVPFAHGGATSGPMHGPESLMQFGLLPALAALARVVSYTDLSQLTEDQTTFFGPRIERGRIHNEAALMEMSRLAAARVFVSHRLHKFPIILGGDHSVSIGTLSEYLDPSISSGRRVGLLWIDAHYDAHTDRTSRSHHSNGMPLATALGRGRRSLGHYRVVDGQKQRLVFRPEDVLHIGAGEMDCEPEEEALLQKLSVKTVRMSDIHESGITAFVTPLQGFLDAVDDVILTIDLDAIRKDFAPAVSFPSEAGLLPSHLFMMARMIAQSKKIRQIEIMEYNPDVEQYANDGAPITAHLVFALLAQLLTEE